MPKPAGPAPASAAATATAVIAVRPEQGPPLSIPLSFFVVGPLALAAAGAMLLLRDDDGVNVLWAPSNVGITHLAAVGLLLFTMTGALYQMLPVVAGAVVRAPRLAHAVHALLVGGATALILGQVEGNAGPFIAATVLLTIALLFFLVPAAIALARSPVRGPTAASMKLALAALAAVGFAGLRMAAARAGLPFEGQWLTLRWAHVHLGFLCWVGALITGISWQVLPMFFLVAPPPRLLAWPVFGGVAASLVALSSPFFFDLPPAAVKWMALPGALAVWVLHPAWVLLAFTRRRRKRRDPTSWYWLVSMGAGPICLLAGAGTAFLDAPKWPMIYGYAVVLAWAGTLVRGMLTRIVPFLVWLHRCAPLVGKVKVPSAKDLLTERQVAIGFWLHVASLFAGAAAISLEAMLVWRVFGASLMLNGGWLGWEIASTLRRAPKAHPPG